MPTQPRSRRKIAGSHPRATSDHTARTGEKERRRLGTPPPAPATTTAGQADTGSSPADASQDDALRNIDRQIHAAMAPFTLGLSPISLYQAWLDWTLHRSIAPGKQIRDAVKASYSGPFVIGAVGPFVADDLEAFVR